MNSLIGNRFSRLVVIIDPMTHKDKVVCQCDCGGKKEADRYALLRGAIKSCGCLRPGNKKKRAYSIWCSMKCRCDNKNEINYERYGERGISYAEEWSTFDNFYADMGDPPSDIHSLDRIDNNRNYNKDNCRWATPKEQALNKRNNKLVTYNGETKPLKMFCDEYRLDYKLVWGRLKKGWDIEQAFFKPKR